MSSDDQQPQVVLCINCGSSTLKYALYDMASGAERVLASGSYDIHCAADLPAALERAMGEVSIKRYLLESAVVAHRLVHGGVRYRAPVVVDDLVLARLRALVPLAPLHLPASLEAIEIVRQHLPHATQIACFDTAFHASLPDVARRLPVPEAIHEAGVQRYGFHGLSFEYVMSVLGASLPRRTILLHLGHGASLAAIQGGVCIDTTMGLTPLGGVMMGTRTGDIDPGVLFYLAREKKMSVTQIEDLVTSQSGLLGVGGTSDMSTLLERRAHDPRAALAVKMFAYSARKAIGAFAAALGGLDLLVFTGGIGEHAAPVRAEICEGLEAFGVGIHAARNAANAEVVSGDFDRVLVRVIPTNENLVVARHARMAFVPRA